MNATLVKKECGKLLFTVEMTEEELAACSCVPNDPVAALLCYVSDQNPEGSPSPAALQQPKEPNNQVQAPKEIEPFVVQGYKEMILEEAPANEKMLAELLLDQLIETNDFPLSEDQIESEVEYTLAGMIQNRKYQAMFSSEDFELDDQTITEMRQEALLGITRELKVEMILKSIIQQENIQASKEELEEAATELAQRQGTTIEMVRNFFGTDLSGLADDVCQKKAIDLLCKEVRYCY